jgi:hypothetical protein
VKKKVEQVDPKLFVKFMQEEVAKGLTIAGMRRACKRALPSYQEALKRSDQTKE